MKNKQEFYLSVPLNIFSQIDAFNQHFQNEQPHIISPIQSLILTVIYSFQKRKKHCWASYQTLGKMLGVTKNVIQHNIKQLESAGYVNIQERKKLNGSSDYLKSLTKKFHSLVMYNGHQSESIYVEETIYKSESIPHSYKIIWGLITYLQKNSMKLSFLNMNEVMPKLTKSVYHKAINFFKSMDLLEDKAIITSFFDEEIKEKLSKPNPKAPRGRSKLSLTAIELEHIESFPEEKREMVYNSIITMKKQRLSVNKKYIKNNNFAQELQFNYDKPSKYEIYKDSMEKQGLSVCPVKNNNRFNRGNNFDMVRKLDIKENYIQITKAFIEEQQENRIFNEIPKSFIQNVFDCFPNILTSLSNSTQIMFKNVIQENGGEIPLESWNTEYDSQVTNFTSAKELQLSIIYIMSTINGCHITNYDNLSLIEYYNNILNSQKLSSMNTFTKVPVKRLLNLIKSFIKANRINEIPMDFMFHLIDDSKRVGAGNE